MGATRHTLCRQETRWPGYCCRGDFPRLDDAGWHVFTASQYDASTDEWQMGWLPVHHIIRPIKQLRGRINLSLRINKKAAQPGGFLVFGCFLLPAAKQHRQIIAAGTPKDVAANPARHAGRHLAPMFRSRKQQRHHLLHGCF